MSISIICIDNRSILENVVKTDLHGKVFLEELSSMPTSCRRILIVPSIISSYIDYFLDAVDSVEGYSIIILALRENFLLKIGSFLIDRSLDQFSNQRNVVGIIVDRLNLNKVNKIKTIHITKHAYLYHICY